LATVPTFAGVWWGFQAILGSESRHQKNPEKIQEHEREEESIKGRRKGT